MSESDFLVSEQCGTTGTRISFYKNENQILSIKSDWHKRSFLNKFQFLQNFWQSILLPYGYPESVSEDYLAYQIWDTLQAFCSTIIGAFSTRAILQGVGVGDSQANVLSATITWILKDGMGMIGRILFAWWKGYGLDRDCKKWRFFADILNDMAMIIELLVPYFSFYSMQMLCVTSGMKSIVGIAGGATRASITHHQAVRDNMADISAKDGSQETVVNLIGNITSIFLLNYFISSSSQWILILSLIVLHLYTNYMAVKSLVFKSFNLQRLALIIKNYFKFGVVLSAAKINGMEPVLLGCGENFKVCSGFDIIIGNSFSQAIKNCSCTNIQELCNFYNRHNSPLYIINANKKKIFVLLEHSSVNDEAENVIKAYFHAAYLGIATCIYNGMPLDIKLKTRLHNPTLISRLYSYMRSSNMISNNANDDNINNNLRNIPLNYLEDLMDLFQHELTIFRTALHVNGWQTDSHFLPIGNCRISWVRNEDKNKDYYQSPSDRLRSHLTLIFYHIAPVICKISKTNQEDFVFIISLASQKSHQITQISLDLIRKTRKSM